MLRTIRSVRSYTTEASAGAAAKRVMGRGKQQQQGQQQQKGQQGQQRNRPSFMLNAKFNKGRKDQAQSENIPKIASNLVPKFALGQIYTPFNMTVKAATQGNTEGVTKVDQFQEANFDPLKLWKDRVTLSQYVNYSGLISGSHTHHLNKKSHKKISKAVRRSRCAGIMPYLHKAPEILKGRGGM
ncbi:37S ribosomal protein rsm18 [Yarrowia sp. C11]|nr:37S ribosomal protein rsm18 [Yarrowia sp. C11]KAG5371051.1 37S ribosomal protein rsm18 [Yarrowia sp. E02]